MDQRVLEVLNTVPKWDFPNRKDFLKAFFSMLTPEEMIFSRNIAQRRKRKRDHRLIKPREEGERVGEAKGGKFKENEAAILICVTNDGSKRGRGDGVEEHTPIQDQPFTATIQAKPLRSEVAKGWWTDYKKSDTVALDIEMVTIKQDGVNKNVAAKVGICDFYGKRISEAKVRRESKSFMVNRFTMAINGITEGGLRNGKPFTKVQREVENILNRKLSSVGHAIGNDFKALDLDAGSFNIFDLQWEYWRRNVDGIRLEFKLKALNKHFFPSGQFQDGIHEAVGDAVATMKIFRETYTREKKMNLPAQMYNAEPVPEGEIEPLKNKK
ncbi:unnamed protein product [Allacma fusca]|uniref:Exonuclease domain-containing protein n=1 Tax=Allacma fusca TaxID=39272 RepID=A0A8J2NTU3_9HEXA|nr:unnamed protein product [Allacma fusca]